MPTVLLLLVKTLLFSFCGYLSVFVWCLYTYLILILPVIYTLPLNRKNYSIRLMQQFYSHPHLWHSARQLTACRTIWWSVRRTTATISETIGAQAGAEAARQRLCRRRAASKVPRRSRNEVLKDCSNIWRLTEVIQRTIRGKDAILLDFSCFLFVFCAFFIVFLSFPLCRSCL